MELSARKSSTRNFSLILTRCSTSPSVLVIHRHLFTNSKYILGLRPKHGLVSTIHPIALRQGVDYSDKARGTKRRLSWLKLPSRTRKVAKDYSVDGYYREVMRTDKGHKKTPAPKALKQPVLHDFQLFSPRIYELLQKEAAAHKVTISYGTFL